MTVLPMVYEFRFDTAHLVFSGFFVLALLTVAGFAAWSGYRALRRQRRGEAAAVRWHEDFAALAPDRRACRFDPDGRRGLGACARGFDCAGCERHARLGAERPPAECTIYVHGLPVLADRGYHRGHTWTQAEPDGTVLVGLDPLARRMFAPSDTVRPAVEGSRLSPGDAILEDPQRHLRVLTPLPGDVVGIQGNGPECVVRLRPAPGPAVELLRGPEAAAWMEAELRWVASRVSPAGPGATALADGGMVADCLPEDLPHVDWSGLREEFFLDV